MSFINFAKRGHVTGNPVELLGYDGRMTKRFRVAQTLDENDSSILLTQREPTTPKTFFNVGQNGTVLRHDRLDDQDTGIPEDEGDINGTERHELELDGVVITLASSTSSQLCKLVFYDLATSANGARAEVFSLGVSEQGTAPHVFTLPAPVRFEQGISMRFVNADDTAGPVADVVTLFYRDISFDSYAELLGPNVRNGESIQAAIDAAADGDTIVVASGFYSENVTLNKNGITLVSHKGSSTIVGIVRLEGNGITIDGFTLSGDGNAAVRGIELAGGDSITVKNMNISEFTTGISMDFASSLGKPTNVSLTKNYFSNNVSGIGSTEGIIGLDIFQNRFESNDEGLGLGQGVVLFGDAIIQDVFASNTFLENEVAIADKRAGGNPTLFDDNGEIIVRPDVELGQSIQAAIDASAEGDTISVASGTFTENILLNKNGVTLVAFERATSIVGTVRLEANDIAIDGFFLSGNIVGSGLVLAGGTTMAVRNMNIESFVNGANLGGALVIPTLLPRPSNVTFEGNTFSGNNSAIAQSQNVQNLQFVNNQFVNNVSGIRLGFGSTLLGNQTISDIFDFNAFSGNEVAVRDVRSGSEENYDNEGNLFNPV